MDLLLDPGRAYWAKYAAERMTVPDTHVRPPMRDVGSDHLVKAQSAKCLYRERETSKKLRDE